MTLAHRLAIAVALLAARPASAQVPAPSVEPAPPTPAERTATAPPPLAQIKDDKQLTEILQSITQDPAIAVDNPAMRPLAQALMAEGVRQLQARSYDQALANFLEAYAKFPSPKILLEVASTLRDMGRLADAANTYQRYLTDPATGPERVAEVKELLLRLDEQLTILTVRVSPHGSDISLDGDPFIAVGSTLMTRVRTGIHLVRIRKDDLSDELSINGFEGENKEVTPKVVAESPPELKGADQRVVPDRVDGWLITGTQYGATDGLSRERRVRSDSGRDVAPIVPHHDVADRSDILFSEHETIESGAIAVVRIDGKGRGFAGGAGLAISRGRLETEILVLKSDVIGGYLGVRFRLLKGVFRPYLAIGVPGFVYDHDEATGNDPPMITRRLAIGVRGAGGLEVKINGHLSVQGDVGYEHFWFVDSHYEQDVLVPTVGVIGRL